MGWFNHQPVKYFQSDAWCCPGFLNERQLKRWVNRVGGFRGWKLPKFDLKECCEDKFYAGAMWRNWCDAMIRFLYISFWSWVNEHFRLVTLWWRWKWHWNVNEMNECLSILIRKFPSIWYQSGQFITTWAKVTWNGGLARQSPPKMALHQFPSSFDV